MNKNRSREDLKQDILYTLGHPTVKIPLTSAQLDKCVDAALKQYQKWHSFGSCETHITYRITEEDVERDYIRLHEDIDAVIEVIPQSLSMGDLSFMSPAWQMAIGAASSLGGVGMSMVDYHCAMQRIKTARQITGVDQRVFEYHRLESMLIPRFPIKAGEFIMMRVYQNLDMERTDLSYVSSGLVFDSETIKGLSVAQAQITMGLLLSKYGNITLPGNITIDGSVILQQGNDSWNAIIEELKNSQPTSMFFG